MKKISAEIIADSLSPQGQRITTILLTFPRFILPELNTHRMFSRNSASSRAIPFEKMVKMVEKDPFTPIAWQKSHSGMQGNEYFVMPEEIADCEVEWYAALDWAIECAKRLHSTGTTKQLCNRLLEPFMWHQTLVTATEWENFFELRCPKYELISENMPLYFKSKKDFNKYVADVGDKPFNLTDIDWLQINNSQAEIHIQALAEAMWDAMNESKPKKLKESEWHIPFGNQMNEEIIEDFILADHEHKGMHYGLLKREEWAEEFNEYKIKIATARCARLSYANHEGEIDYEKDIQLHDRLLKNGHLSPFEHVARVMNSDEYLSFIKGQIVAEYVEALDEEVLSYVSKESEGWCNNFKEFIPYRYLIENE